MNILNQKNKMITKHISDLKTKIKLTVKERRVYSNRQQSVKAGDLLAVLRFWSLTRCY